MNEINFKRVIKIIQVKKSKNYFAIFSWLIHFLKILKKKSIEILDQ